MSIEQSASTPSSLHAGRRHALVAVKIAVSLILLWILFSRIDVSQLWASAQMASIPWLVAALGIYAATVAASVWRWHLLLDAQNVHVETNRLAGSYLVALFFNNFLPSNIGGDVIRIRDTARPAGSMTLATAVVLVDRGLGQVVGLTPGGGPVVELLGQPGLAPVQLGQEQLTEQLVVAVPLLAPVQRHQQEVGALQRGQETVRPAAAEHGVAQRPGHLVEHRRPGQERHQLR